MGEIEKNLQQLIAGDEKALARCITIVENELDGFLTVLSSLKFEKSVAIIGFTGPPGAGKSTLINALLSLLSEKNKKIGVIAIDPTSPFNYGSLLGDRLRMSEHFGDKNIFIRSLATRGSLGGLSAKTIEIVDVMKAFGFDYVFIETVGVGQSEVEIAGLADTTVLVLAPGFGDEVQTIKSGIMEIGDIFIVNKSDSPGAEGFAKTIEQLVHSRKKSNWTSPVILASATNKKGIEEIMRKIDEHNTKISNDKKVFLLTEKAYKLIQNNRMKNLDKKILQEKIEKEMKKNNFNLYEFVKKF